MSLVSDLRINGTKVQYYNKFHNTIIIMLIGKYAECVANDERYIIRQENPVSRLCLNLKFAFEGAFAESQGKGALVLAFLRVKGRESD